MSGNARPSPSPLKTRLLCPKFENSKGNNEAISMAFMPKANDLLDFSGFCPTHRPQAGKLTSDSIISPAQRSNRESRSEHLNVKQVETHSIVSIVLFGICLTVGWVAVATDKKLGK
jgi:hypothetical protein